MFDFERKLNLTKQFTAVPFSGAHAV